ncbi:MAG: CRISPR-associated protein Csx28 [Bacteroides graminisolvens]|nr:CRISPR-associated protein Csx28 [Bacteroides graminisolvens]
MKKIERQKIKMSFTEFLSIFVEPITIIVLAIWGGKQGYKYWLKQKKEEGLYLQRQSKYEAKLAAGKALWALLRYISESDHDENIFRRGELNESGKKVFYFRQEQANHFITELNDVFYIKGHGLFLDQTTKTLIFELRSQVFGWLHVSKKSGEEDMKITNAKKFERINQIRDELHKKLKEQILVEASINETV